MTIEIINHIGLTQIYKDKDLICNLYKGVHDNEFSVNELYDSFPELTSAELRQIADKLDELNNAK